MGDRAAGRRSRRQDRSEHWIVTVDGRAVGWTRCYPAVDEPEEIDRWWDFGVDRAAAGIDYLLGEPGDRGRGVGAAMIRAFVDDVVFARHPEWTQAAAGPYEANVASWRALEKAGFRHVGTIDDDEGPCRLMVIDRSAPAAALPASS